MKLQIVEYVADEAGYRPEIRYEGEPNNSDQGIIGSTGAGRNNGQAGYPSGGPATDSGIDGTNLPNGYKNGGVSGYASGGPGQNGFSRNANGGVGQNIDTAAPSDRPGQERNSGYPKDNPNERVATAFNSANNGANSDFGNSNGGRASNGNVVDGYSSQGNIVGYPNSGFGPNGNEVFSNPTQSGLSGYPSGGPEAKNKDTFGNKNSVSAVNVAFSASNGYPNEGVAQNNPAQTGYSSGRPEQGRNSNQNYAGGSSSPGGEGYPRGSPSIRGTGY